VLAQEFAAAFDSAQWGHIAGLWHDLGKYRLEFQRRIRGSREQVEHAGAGAALANETAACCQLRSRCGTPHRARESQSAVSE